jgi:uncharacterized membrane protein
MKDEQIQTSLARLMIGGVVVSATIILVGLVWFVAAHSSLKLGDHIFAGEPKYFENPVSMISRALDKGALGERRSIVMIGVMLLLLTPLARVAFAAFGFALQKDRLYTVISLVVLGVLIVSFFW